MATNKYIIQLIVETGTGQAKVQGVAKAFENLEASAKRVRPSLEKAKKATDGMGGAAGIAGAAAAEMGRTISDLPYGIQAVTNNISQLGSMFALLVSSSGGVRQAFTNLGKTLLGPAGILIAFQVVVAAIDFFAQAQRKTKKDIEDTTAAIDLQVEAIERIIGAFKAQDLIKQFGLLSGDGIGGAFDGAEARLEGLVQFLMDKAPEFREAIEALTPEQREDYQLLQRMTKDYAGINSLRERARSLEKDILEARKEGKDISELQNDLFETEQAIFLRLQNLKPIPGETLDDFEEGIELSDAFIKRVLNIKEELQEPIFGAFFDLNNLEQDVLEEVDALLKPMEDARRAALDALLETDDPILFYENELAELQLFLSNKQKLEELDFEQYKRLKLEEKSLSDFVREAKFRNAMAEIDARQQIYDSVSTSLGQLSSLFGEATAEGKMFALAQIAFDTATGFTQGLDIAQKTSAAAGPFAAFAFPIFYAAQIASVLSAVGQAKQVLSASAAVPGGGGGISTPSAPSSAPPLSTLPSFNVVGSSNSQLAQILGAQGQQPVKAYVVAGEVSSAQSLERNRVKEASI